MRLTRQAALAIALLAGLLAALGAWMIIGQQSKPKEKQPTTVQLPVPIASIPATMEVQADMLRTVDLPRDQVPANAVLDAQQLQGRIAVVQLEKDKPVRIDQVTERTRLGMAFTIPPGLRGMAVSLDIVGTVGDFVQPRDRVDVLTAIDQNGQVVVRTLVQDVEVLALGQTTDVPPPTAETTEEGTAAKQPTAPRRTETPVTLAVTPAQAQQLLTADRIGDLRLTLRAKHDTSIIPLPMANSWTMVGQLPPKPGTGPAPGAQPPAQQPAPPQGPARGPVSGGVQIGTVTAGQSGLAPAGAPAAAKARPKQPYVEVIRGDSVEIIVP